MQHAALAASSTHTQARITEAIGELRTTTPGFHAFEREGEHLVYDLETASILRVDEQVYGLLEAVEAGGDSQEASRRLVGAGVDESAVDEVLALRDCGLFQPMDPVAPEAAGRVVESLVNHHPRKIMLMVQTNCNLKCSYCYEVLSGFHSTGKSMSFEQAKHSVDYFVKSSGRRRQLQITFFGGEPLINFEVVKQVVAYCKELEKTTDKEFSYSLTTNCTLITDDVIDFVVEHEFTGMFSLDGPPELSDIHRKDLAGKGVGEKATKNALRLAKAQDAAGVRQFMVRATLTRQNRDSRLVTKYFEDLGFKRVMIGATSGRAGTKGEWDIVADDSEDMTDEAREKLEAFIDWKTGDGPRPVGTNGIVRNLNHFRKNMREKKSLANIGCGVGRNMLAFGEDGSLYPCHRYAGEEAYKLGTVESGLDVPKMREYYSSIIDQKLEHCGSCWARYTCGGQCAWSLSDEEGDLHLPEEENCRSIRRGHELMLYAMHRLQTARATEGQVK